MHPEAVIIRRGCGSFLKHNPDALNSRRCHHRFVQQGLSFIRIFKIGVGSYEWFDRHVLYYHERAYS